MTLRRQHDGTLPAYAWPGGYEIHYMTQDNGILCHQCANQENGSLAHESQDDPQWKIVAHDIHWAGEAIQCDHCGRPIVSTYGVPTDVFQKGPDLSPVFGERHTDDCGVVWQMVGQNDLNVPYWAKVVNNVVQKTTYTLWYGERLGRHMLLQLIGKPEEANAVFTIRLPGDMFDAMEDYAEYAIEQAREDATLHVIPCEWTAEHVSGEPGDNEVIFKVTRKA